MPFSLPKVALKAVPSHARGAWQVWNLVKGLNVSEIAEAAERPFHLALVGALGHTDLLAARLALESAEPRDLGPSGPADISGFVQNYPAEADVPAAA